MTKLLDRLTLAAKFATILAAVLGFFFLFAAVLVTWQMGQIEAGMFGQASQGLPADAAARLQVVLASGFHDITIKVILVMLAATVGVVAAVYVLFIIMIRRRLAELADRFRDVSEGERDLRRRIEVRGNDGMTSSAAISTPFSKRCMTP